MASPLSLDELELKIMPQWARERGQQAAYADFEGEPTPSPGERRRGGRRPAGGARERPDTGERRRGTSRLGDRERPRGPTRGGAGRRDGPGAREDTRRRHSDDQTRERIERPVALDVEIDIEFEPLPMLVDNLVEHLKSAPVAYPLFALARLFLSRPERHRIRLATGRRADAAVPLYQAGEGGPVCFDRERAETIAFRRLWPSCYREETVEGEAPRGQFTSVARCGLSGTLLGPTNHHDFARRARAIWERRYSGRMGFEEYRARIETVRDAETIERWKEEARVVRRYVALGAEEGEERAFASLAEAEKDFRARHAPGLVRAATRVEMEGTAVRELPDAALRARILEAWRRENRFADRLGRTLGSRLVGRGLHIFKFRRKVVCVTSVRPVPLAADEHALCEGVRAILRALGSVEHCTRRQLLETILGPRETVAQSDGEGGAAQARDREKIELAGHLHWLLGCGHVIEFHDGRLALPTPARPAPSTEPPAEPDAPPPEPATPAGDGR